MLKILPYEEMSETWDTLSVDSGFSPGTIGFSSPTRLGSVDLSTFPRLRGAATKRALDLIFVGVSSPIWLPALLVFGLLLKLSDPKSPTLFCQPRTGRYGQRFPMLKFRTMVANAEEVKEAYRDQSTVPWPDFKMENDPRITSIGKIYRKYRIDEIPQLLNVLSGSMTLVGPRPTSFDKNTYKLWHTERLDATPGITGSWQVSGQQKTTFDERARSDIEYIRSTGTINDLTLLGKTFSALRNGM